MDHPVIDLWPLWWKVSIWLLELWYEDTPIIIYFEHLTICCFNVIVSSSPSPAPVCVTFSGHALCYCSVTGGLFWVSVYFFQYQYHYPWTKIWLQPYSTASCKIPITRYKAENCITSPIFCTSLCMSRIKSTAKSLLWRFISKQNVYQYILIPNK